MKLLGKIAALVRSFGSPRNRPPRSDKSNSDVEQARVRFQARDTPPGGW